MTDLAKLTLSESVKGIKDKKFSSREITQACLNAIDSNSDLGAFITVCHDEAMNAAGKADEALSKGEAFALCGVPVAIKDMILTNGIKTTAASKILENFNPAYDATVVSKLKEAGAIIIGKTNMDEFAMGSSNENSAYGSVKNPWDRSRVPGGSSGGSATAVSACLVPAALGTDTGGSIRQPASLTNTVGIKPTYGRVSRYGVIAFASSLDQVGTFTRTVEDCCLLTQVISGNDPYDATSSSNPVPNWSDSLNKGVKGLRIGIPKEYFISGLQPEVEESIKSAIKQFSSLGAEIVEISLPHTELAVSVYYIIAPAEASSNLARYDGIRYGYRVENPKDLTDLYKKSRSQGFGSEVKRRIAIGTYVLSAGYFDAFYVKAQKVRSLITNDFTKAFENKCDVILSPVSPTTAFKIGEKTADPLQMYLNDIFTIPVNLAGLPAMSVQCGFDKNNLPIGVHLIAPHWREDLLFQTASAYQSSTDWHKRTP